MEEKGTVSHGMCWFVSQALPKLVYVPQAPCCGKAYVCRLCHDAEEDHQMDRFLVKEVQCSVCNTVQQVILLEGNCCQSLSPIYTVHSTYQYGPIVCPI